MFTQHAHGNWDIQLLESINIILIKRSGAWNKEAALQYVDDFNQKVVPLIGKKWASVGYAVDYGLGVPEMDSIISELYREMVSNGCVCQTTVIKSALSAQHLARMASIKSEVYQLKFVNSPDQAVSFLKTLGFELPIEDFIQFIEKPYPDRFD